LNSKNKLSELFDSTHDILEKDEIMDSLTQLPCVDLGEDFDLKDIVNKTLLTSGTAISTAQQISNVSWSKGHISGLQVYFLY
jgi:hypothetical protein